MEYHGMETQKYDSELPLLTIEKTLKKRFNAINIGLHYGKLNATIDFEFENKYIEEKIEESTFLGKIGIWKENNVKLIPVENPSLNEILSFFRETFQHDKSILVTAKRGNLEFKKLTEEEVKNELVKEKISNTLSEF